MKQVKAKVSEKGYKIGDFILVDSGKFGRITKMIKWVLDEQDYQVKRGVAKAGDIANRYFPITIQTILTSRFERPKRKSSSQIYEYQIVRKVDKAFVKKIFKNLNDMIVYVKMINEQEEITDE